MSQSVDELLRVLQAALEDLGAVGGAADCRAIFARLATQLRAWARRFSHAQPSGGLVVDGLLSSCNWDRANGCWAEDFDHASTVSALAHSIGHIRADAAAAAREEELDAPAMSACRAASAASAAAPYPRSPTRVGIPQIMRSPTRVGIPQFPRPEQAGGSPGVITFGAVPLSCEWKALDGTSLLASSAARDDGVEESPARPTSSLSIPHAVPKPLTFVAPPPSVSGSLKRPLEVAVEEAGGREADRPKTAVGEKKKVADSRKKRRSTTPKQTAGGGNKSSNPKSCNCSKSRCLKLYCECFSAQVFCGEACRCKSCANTEAQSEAVLAARAKVEQHRFGKTGGCTCAKSKCLKKYCECFKAEVRARRSVAIASGFLLTGSSVARRSDARRNANAAGVKTLTESIQGMAAVPAAPTRTTFRQQTSRRCRARLGLCREASLEA